MSLSLNLLILCGVTLFGCQELYASSKSCLNLNLYFLSSQTCVCVNIICNITITTLPHNVCNITIIYYSSLWCAQLPALKNCKVTSLEKPQKSVLLASQSKKKCPASIMPKKNLEVDLSRYGPRNDAKKKIRNKKGWTSLVVFVVPWREIWRASKLPSRSIGKKKSCQLTKMCFRATQTYLATATNSRS